LAGGAALHFEDDLSLIDLWNDKRINFLGQFLD